MGRKKKWLQTVWRINDSSMEWLIRNVHQGQAVRTNSPGSLGFPDILTVVVSEFFSPLLQFSKLLHLLQTCRLSNMAIDRDVGKASHYFLIGNVIHRSGEAFLEFPIKVGREPTLLTPLLYSFRQFGATCITTLSINIKQSYTRVAVLGCARKGNEKIMTPFFQVHLFLQTDEVQI